MSAGGDSGAENGDLVLESSARKTEKYGDNSAPPVSSIIAGTTTFEDLSLTEMSLGKEIRTAERLKQRSQDIAAALMGIGKDGGDEHVLKEI